MEGRERRRGKKAAEFRYVDAESEFRVASGELGKRRLDVQRGDRPRNGETREKERKAGRPNRQERQERQETDNGKAAKNAKEAKGAKRGGGLGIRE